MPPKWGNLHKVVLLVLHELLYGGTDQYDSPTMRVLNAWYEEHKESVEQTAADCAAKGTTTAEAAKL